jgi:hypothetical protein
MTASRREDRAAHRLTVHFFRGLFDFGVLSESGSDAFMRVLIGIIAVLLTFGLLLTRMFMSAASSGRLSSLSPAPYRTSIETLIIALPMVIVAFAAVLVSQSLFPDETDFRVLLVLPISRRLVFLSKLAALALFAGIFIVAAHVAMLPLFITISIGARAGEGFLPRLGAHAVASVAASTFVVLAVAGINGALLVTVPRRFLQEASTGVRSLMLCILVLALPLVARLPGIAPLLAAGSPSLLAAPPVWFVAIEELLLGQVTPYFVRLASIGGAAFVAALVLSVGSYLMLYRRFDRMMLRPPESSGRAWRGVWLDVRRRNGRYTAIAAFVRWTLARSALHQGVFIAIAAVGAGLVVNSFLGVRAIPRIQTYETALANTVTWTPFALVFAMTLAVRSALALPIEPRANWVFRIAEYDEGRVDQIDAVVGSMIDLGVIVPLAILFPLGWMMFGVRAIPSSAIAFMLGVLLVELEMGEWRRIPFTCSYMPGKRFVGLTLLIGFAAFVVFTSIGSGLAYYGRAHPVGSIVVLAILGVVVWERRRRRARLSRHTPLLFEDLLPTEIEPLQLSMY